MKFCFYLSFINTHTMMFDLISVASVIDDETKMVYAIYQNGAHDSDSKRPLSEMSDSWFLCLDEYDRLVVKQILKN